MEKIKKNKGIEGITLVALVVTVVVLLILAGISINLLIGENGILKKAVKSKRDIGEAETIEQLDFAVSSAFVTAKGNISKIDETDLENGLKKYDENSRIFKSQYLKSNLSSTYKKDTIESDKNFYAYINGKYYIQKNDTNEWEVADSLVFDISMAGICNMYMNATWGNVDLIKLESYVIPIIDEGFEPLEYGIIYKASSTCTDEEMKFTSYTGMGEYSLGNGIRTYRASVKDSFSENWPILRVVISMWYKTGNHPGTSGRAFLTEKNPETGEIRINYSRIVSANASDFPRK